MEKDKDGTWRTTITGEQGRHNYRFGVEAVTVSQLDWQPRGKLLPDRAQGVALQDMLVSVSFCKRRQQNSGTGLGVGLGVMMLQGDAQMLAHIGQCGRAQIPHCSGHFDGANEGLLERLNSGRIAAGPQHRAVERGIVRGDEIHPFQLLRGLLP